MAVRAEQDALLHLGSTPSQRSRVSPVPDMEILAPGVDVMKLQGAYPARVSAKEASTARLLDKRALDAPPPLRHCQGTTFLAAVVAASLEDELGGPVSHALESREPRSVTAPLSACLSSIGSLDAIPLEPITNRRWIATEFVCHLRHCGTPPDPAFEVGLTQRTQSRVLLGARSGHAILLQPVPDGRRMLANLPPNRLQRHSVGKAFLQEPPLHAERMPARSDRTLRTRVRVSRPRRAPCGLCAPPGRRALGSGRRGARSRRPRRRRLSGTRCGAARAAGS